ncbi:metallopeptidase family protein [Paraliomyxa miuraensis]|uniref:metallopeptidase family protein n=1 Tax=Paraliomyxa miuraensis TaxID=376150 RepID=UPI002254E044|nr:metallopeptidase family protein [Paraliomyxa miuraensis]MCX4244671.1 metallopeptidase family protein [Paraliomyxa miuraensis]
MPDALHAADRAVVDHLVEEALALLDDGRDEAAARNLAEAQALAPHDPTVLAALGELSGALGRLDEARDHLRAAIAAFERAGPPIDRAPALADAHHALARLHQDAGEHDLQVHHDLEVSRLDAAAHRRAGLGSRRDLALVERATAQALDRIPEPFQARLRNVPVVLEPRPSIELVREGFDPRALGLFEGPDDLGRLSVEAGPADRPTRIVLFFANLLDAFPDDGELCRQVEITLLHEIGHFFGLDEDEVDALGLG